MDDKKAGSSESEVEILTVFMVFAGSLFANFRLLSLLLLGKSVSGCSIIFGSVSSIAWRIALLISRPLANSGADVFMSV